MLGPQSFLQEEKIPLLETC